MKTEMAEEVLATLKQADKLLQHLMKVVPWGQTAVDVGLLNDVLVLMSRTLTKTQEPEVMTSCDGCRDLGVCDGRCKVSDVNTQAADPAADVVSQFHGLELHLAGLLKQVEMGGGKYGHIYDGPDCLLCGHFGPADEPTLCAAETRFAEVRRRLSELEDEQQAWTGTYEQLRTAQKADFERAEKAEAVVRELRQKLAIAGVEGSPPPGEDTTLGALMARVWAAEARVRELEKRLLEDHLQLPDGSDSKDSIAENGLVTYDSIMALRRWVAQEKERCAKEGSVFDTSFRCVSDGRQLWYVDPETILALRERAKKLRLALIASNDYIDAAVEKRSRWYDKQVTAHGRTSLEADRASHSLHEVINATRNSYDSVARVLKEDEGNDTKEQS